jgi:phenylpropionate dioxygenase-like ring-hydroxylating dioxygenase large terminal subunit
VGLLLDNQLDAGHFPFVHTTTFGTPAGAPVPPPEMIRSGTTIRASTRVPIAARNDPMAQAGERALQRHRTMHYEFHAPLWLRLQLDDEDLGGSTIILFSLTPLAAGRARMDVDLHFRHPDGFTAAQLDERVAFEERVIGEDLRLQRGFEDLRLPLDPAAEVHTKADRLSLQVRQLLRELLSTGDPGTLA